MRNRAYLGCFALALAVPIIISTGHAAEDDFKPEEGFHSLFNGKDLKGWSYRGSKEKLDGKTRTADGRIVVEDGTIVMKEKDNAGKGGIKVLETNKIFAKGFHFRTEFKAALKADSGVYVRQPQLQVRDFLRRNEQKHLQKFKNDDWNTLDVIVRDNQIVTLVNNKPLLPTDDLSVTIRDGKADATLNGKAIDAKSVQVRKASVAECLCNGEWFETMINIPARGPIGLQAETGTFAFRRVRVKEME